MDAAAASALGRLAEVMHAIRRGCPWDAEQTHASLVRYLVEESAELVEAIESGDDEHLREELGDVLLQVFFHAEIASETGRFTIADVATGIADKLERRHPYVFADVPVPDDLDASWEAAKKAEKGRSSALDGIPATLEPLARASRMIARARTHGVPIDLPSDPITADALGAELVALVARGQASGIDADQVLRAAARALADRIAAAENV